MVIVVEREIVIHRPPADVFRYLAEEFLDHAGAIHPAVVEVEKLGEGPLGKGARLREAVLVMGKRRERELVVDEWEPGSLFALREAAPSSWETRCLDRYRLFHVEDGTRIELRVERAWTMLAFRLFRPLAKRRLARETAQSLARAKAALEAR